MRSAFVDAHSTSREPSRWTPRNAYSRCLILSEPAESSKFHNPKCFFLCLERQSYFNSDSRHLASAWSAKFHEDKFHTENTHAGISLRSPCQSSLVQRQKSSRRWLQLPQVSPQLKGRSRMNYDYFFPATLLQLSVPSSSFWRLRSHLGENTVSVVARTPIFHISTCKRVSLEP
jgi:hypothetical protein